LPHLALFLLLRLFNPSPAAELRACRRAFRAFAPHFCGFRLSSIVCFVSIPAPAFFFLRGAGRGDLLPITPVRSAFSPMEDVPLHSLCVLPFSARPRCFSSFARGSSWQEDLPDRFSVQRRSMASTTCVRLLSASHPSTFCFFPAGRLFFPSDIPLLPFPDSAGGALGAPLFGGVAVARPLILFLASRASPRRPAGASNMVSPSGRHFLLRFFHFFLAMTEVFSYEQEA